MNYDNLFPILEQHNRFWTEKKIPVTQHVRRHIFEDIYTALRSNRLIKIIEGPRRVGKSYLMHQLIEAFLIDPEIYDYNILYFQFNSTMNEKNFITSLINTYIKNIADPKRPIYLFFDEIQFVDYWQDQVKQYYDFYPNMHFVLTGSTSLFHRQKSRESLLGRIQRFKVNSLSFLEYLRFRGYADIPHPFDWDRDPTPSERLQVMKLIPLFRNEFNTYLFFGEYPELASQSLEEKPSYYIRDIINTLASIDIPYLFPRLDRALFLNLIKTISFNISCEFSYSNLGATFDCDRRIISEYIKLLEETHLFSACTNSYFVSMRRKLSGSKKLYTYNSNIALNINGFDVSYLNDARVRGQYVENYVFSRLMQRYNYEKIEYYRDGGREIDFVTPQAIVEVKSGQLKHVDKYKHIAKTLKKRLAIIKEDEFTMNDDCQIIPFYIL